MSHCFSYSFQEHNSLDKYAFILLTSGAALEPVTEFLFDSGAAVLPKASPLTNRPETSAVCLQNALWFAQATGSGVDLAEEPRSDEPCEEPLVLYVCVCMCAYVHVSMQCWVDEMRLARSLWTCMHACVCVCVCISMQLCMGRALY